MRIVYLLTAILIALPAFAQKYEFGVQGGISFYDKKTVTNRAANADAGFNPGMRPGSRSVITCTSTSVGKSATHFSRTK